MSEVPAGGIDPGGQSVLLTAESEKNLEALRRALRRNPAFAIYVLVVDSRARSEVERRLRAWPDSPGFPHWRVLGEETKYVDLIAALENKQALDGDGGLVIPDLDALLEDESGPALAALNVARDRLASVIDGPFVIVVSPERATELSLAAPDLFDVRAASYQIESQPFVMNIPPGGQEFLEYLGIDINTDTQNAGELRQSKARLEHLGASALSPPAGAMAAAWLALADKFLIAGETDEARLAAEESARLARGSNFTAALAESEAILGEVEAHKGKYDAAESHFKEGVKLARRSKDMRALAVSLFRSAATARFLRRFEHSKELLRESIEVGKKIGLKNHQAMILLGHVFLNLGRLRDAERQFKESLRHAERSTDAIVMGGAFLGIAEVQFARRARADAETSLRRSLEFYDRAGNVWGISDVRARLGRFLLEENRLDESEEQFVAAIDLVRKVAVAGNLQNYLALLATVYTRQGRQDSAEAAAREALDLARSSGRSEMVAAVLVLLSDIVRTAGRTDEADALVQEAKQLSPVERPPT